MAAMGAKRTLAIPLECALQAMNPHDATASLRHYWNSKHPDPTMACAFGTNGSVDDKAQLSPEGIGPHAFKNSLGRFGIARHGPWPGHRSSSGESKQRVHLLGPAKSVVMCDVAAPVPAVRVPFSIAQVRCNYKDEPIFECPCRLFLEERIGERARHYWHHNIPREDAPEDR